jgi:hypothetical protein
MSSYLLKRLDAATGAVQSAIVEDDEVLNSLHYVRDGRYFAGMVGRDLRLYAADSLTQVATLGRTPLGYSNVAPLTYSNVGAEANTLVARTGRRHLQAWDARPQGTWPFGRVRRFVAVDMHPDRGHLAAHTQDSLFILRYAGAPVEAHRPCPEGFPQEGVKRLRYTPGGRLLVTCAGLTIRLYDPAQRATVATLDHRQAGDEDTWTFDSWRLFQEGRRLITVTGRPGREEAVRVHLWGLPEGTPLHVSTFKARYTGEMRDVRTHVGIGVSESDTHYAEHFVSPDEFLGQAVRATSGNQDTIFVRSAADGRVVRRLPTQIEGRGGGSRLRFAGPDDEVVLVSAGDSVYVYDRASGQRTAAFENTVQLDISPDRSRVLLGIHHKADPSHGFAADTLLVVDVTTCDTLQALRHAGMPASSGYAGYPRWTGDDHIFAPSRTPGRFVAIWGPGGALVTTLRDVDGPFGRVDDERKLAVFESTGEPSGGVVYDYAKGVPRAVLRDPDGLRRAYLAPDGSFAVTLNEKGRLRRWPLFASPQALIDSARATVTRQLTPEQRQRAFLAPVEGDG